MTDEENTADWSIVAVCWSVLVKFRADSDFKDRIARWCRPSAVRSLYTDRAYALQRWQTALKCLLIKKT